MKIECKIKRKEGSRSEMDGIKYHFLPNEAGAHVCDVSDNGHIKRFLSIAAYDIYDPEGKIKAKIAASKQAAAPQAPAPIETKPNSNKPKAKTAKEKKVAPKKGKEKPKASVLSVNNMSDDDAFIFANENMGIANPQDTDQLIEFAADNMGLELPEDLPASEMVRILIERSQSQAVVQ